jgi:hypothetical protein
LVAASPAQAQRPAKANWQAAYWNNTTLSGPPVLRRTETSINHTWGAESPAPEVHDNNFSARWTADVNFRPATYRFAATGDDGIRVWVDGDLIIDAWYDHPAETFVADKNLSAGRHHIAVEYYEHRGGAVAQLWWAPAPPKDDETWRGAYYNNTSFRGDPVLVRQDPVIGFNWTTVSPGSGVNRDSFSVRWTRTVDLPAGRYRFKMTVDDGGRLWVNGRLLIDAWQVQSPQTYTAETYLPGGSIPIKMEYFDNQAGAVAKLSWSPEPIRPTSQWRGEYFDSIKLQEGPVLVRTVPEIDFNWGTGSPAPDQLGVDLFGARWTRTLDLPAGRYRFTMTVDDGGRLWLDDQLIIDAWKVQAAETYTGEANLSGEPVVARMEYFENRDKAVAQLSWHRIRSIPQTPTDWREEIPARWHPIFQRCLDHFDEIGLEIGPSPDWDALLEQCKRLTGSE